MHYILSNKFIWHTLDIVLNILAKFFYLFFLYSVAGWIYSATSNYHLTMLLNGATVVLSFVVLVPLYVLFYC